MAIPDISDEDVLNLRECLRRLDEGEPMEIVLQSACQFTLDFLQMLMEE